MLSALSVPFTHFHRHSVATRERVFFSKERSTAAQQPNDFHKDDQSKINVSFIDTDTRRLGCKSWHTVASASYLYELKFEI